MLGYFDTSLLLSILQNESAREQALEVWNACEERYSSILLRIEGVVSLRRDIANWQRLGGHALERREFGLNRMLVGISLVPLEIPIAEIVEREPRLAHCRSQDAAHLATALFLQRESGESITVCSYDTRMRDVARELGFALLPK